MTVRIAVVCYLWRTILQIRVRFQRVTALQSVAWVTGCIFYLLHVGLAFAFVHDWSHGAALEHTAIETERVTGIHRGEGLWVNYVFSLMWIADAVRVVAARRFHRPTNRNVDYFVAACFAFIFINATVVFGPPFYRWGAVPVAALIVIVWNRSAVAAPAEGERE